MTRHETASQVTGTYVEFQAAVLRALPRNIDPDVALGWTQNGESLTRILRETLMPDRKYGNTYPVTVNYDLSVEDAVKLGRYNWNNSDIMSKNFPTKRKGTAEVAVELVHFNWHISTDEALKELDRMGRRPAELLELLAFGEKYPEVQREFPITALGSVWRSLDGRRYVPCLRGLGSLRRLNLHWIGHDWDVIFRFAAVRK